MKPIESRGVMFGVMMMSLGCPGTDRTDVVDSATEAGSELSNSTSTASGDTASGDTVGPSSGTAGPSGDAAGPSGGTAGPSGEAAGPSGGATGSSGDTASDDTSIIGDSSTLDPVDPVPMSGCEDVDILLVIDDSGSMAEEQASLAAVISALVEALEAPGVRANYRLGFTTTDVGNPVCAGVGAEAGRLVASSCHQRLSNFVHPGEQIVDRTDICHSLCPAALTDFEFAASATELDPDPKPRPWLERIDEIHNVPADVEVADAAACLALQGISGCGFEQPLEAMYRALLRADLAGDPSYGFLRTHASLVIVFLTDEADCSYHPDHQEIFVPNGSRVFWSDPAESLASSAVCWNAGVACEGDTCRSADYGPSGAEVSTVEAAEGGAVLYPVQRYIDFLAQIEARKKATHPDLEVRVVGITGVPEGYDGALTYDLVGTDPAFVSGFGVAPGCESEQGLAVPPVRLREFAEAFRVGDENNLFSVCGDDYRPAFTAVGDALCRVLYIP